MLIVRWPLMTELNKLHSFLATCSMLMQKALFAYSQGLSFHGLQVKLANGRSKVFPVVHNYGHGGSGVTLHWGCAADAVQLVRQHLAHKVEALPAAKL